MDASSFYVGRVVGNLSWKTKVKKLSPFHKLQVELCHGVSSRCYTVTGFGQGSHSSCGNGIAGQALDLFRHTLGLVLPIDSDNTEVLQFEFMNDTILSPGVLGVRDLFFCVCVDCAVPQKAGYFLRFIFDAPRSQQSNKHFKMTPCPTFQ